MSVTQKLPARINLQIREGAQNVLKEFELEVRNSRPNAAGRTTHDVDIADIVEVLAEALRDEMDKLLAESAEPAEHRAWLAEVRDWIFDGRAS
jgi:hypothetical protein